MVRSLFLIAAFGLAMAPLAYADQSAAPPPDTQAKIQQAALKSCNDDLSADRFDRWSTMEDCVADKTAKMTRAYRASQTGAATSSH